MSDWSVNLRGTKDDLHNWISIKGEGGSTDVLKIEFRNHPLIDKVFIEKITKALMEEVVEQFVSWREGESYDRNSTYFNRKKAERTAIKIIENMKRGANGL
ncbi:hypothetical protein [Endozoicomonas sp. SESOKO1]|uniref:hypothetical protein n=1 Tax=Endozoicomonas sp. SESOKO1 TaxID=2828742 RepID=UPI002148D968|nr:hypothetical protein [Endozoicomonas sp. SESOKO1]